MNKLSKMISELGKEDLLKIKRDLVAGNIDRLVEKKLSQFKEENYSEKFCPVCSGEITKEAFVLEFGKHIRKKAYFDGVDCMEYFVSKKLNLKKENETPE